MLMVGSFFVFGHDYDFSLQEKEVKVVKCYPNPAVSFVNFEFDKSIDKAATLQIYSFTGKKMADMPITLGKITVQLDEYFRGIYVSVNMSVYLRQQTQSFPDISELISFIPYEPQLKQIGQTTSVTMNIPYEILPHTLIELPTHSMIIWFH